MPATSWVECPQLTIDLDRTPAERVADIPDDALQKGRRLLDGILQQIPRAAFLVADAARWRTAGRFHPEATAIAQRVGVAWRDVMVANISYDLALGTTWGCSTAAIATADGPVLARNMDWWPESLLAQTSYLIHACAAGRPRYHNAGWPGMLGVVSGLSARGFGVVLNAVGSEEPPCWTGYPVLLFLRSVLEDAEDYEDAVARLCRQRLAAPGLFTIVGTRNDQRVVIERTPRRHTLRHPESDGQPLIATNHYRATVASAETDALEALYASTCSRFESLTALLTGYDPGDTINDDALLFILTEPLVRQEITAQHVIMRPASGQIRLFVPGDLLSDQHAAGKA
jgi:hypothetical protein